MDQKLISDYYSHFNKYKGLVEVNKTSQSIVKNNYDEFNAYLFTQNIIYGSDSFEVFGIEFKHKIEINLNDTPRGFFVVYHDAIDVYGNITRNEVERYWFDKLGNTEHDQNSNPYIFGAVLLFIKSNNLTLLK